MDKLAREPRGPENLDHQLAITRTTLQAYENELQESNKKLEDLKAELGAVKAKLNSEANQSFEEVKKHAEEAEYKLQETRKKLANEENRADQAVKDCSEAMKKLNAYMNCPEANQNFEKVKKRAEEAEYQLRETRKKLAEEENRADQAVKDCSEATNKLNAYMKRPEESQFENLPHFEGMEVAEARSRNIIDTGRNNHDRINHDYPCLWESCLCVTIYYIVATWLVMCYKDDFQGMKKGCELCNAFYFVVVLSSTVGYGDLYPVSDEAVRLTHWLIIFSSLNSVFIFKIVAFIWTLVRKKWLHSVVGMWKRIFIGVLALAAIFISLVVGFVGAANDLDKNSKIKSEDANRDAWSLSYITLTTVGFGNISFLTSSGRIFASIWILICVPPFNRASTYLAEQIVSILRFLWQDLLKPYFRDTAFPFLRGLVWPAAPA